MDEITVAWIAAAFFSLVGWGSLIHFTWIVSRWPKARGRVVDNIAEWSKSRTAEHNTKRDIYFPQIEFDAGGKMHRAKGGIGKAKPWEIGTPIELHYKPANPDHVLDFNLWQRLLFSGAFIVFGGLCLAAAMGWVS